MNTVNPYPLLLKPPVKDYLWGGERLKTEFGFEAGAGPAAEAWVLSCHKDGQSVVENGELAGHTLSQALERMGPAAVGKKAASFPYFPLLIKLIDARDRLSVQVHPNDEYAQRIEGEYGKTEMWYVVDCEPGAQLIYGFNRDLSRDEFRRRIENNTLTEVCNVVPVSKGDVFFIQAGTLHAIGAGILIAEVQQNSNTTYRVSDYGRLGADGKPRALHIDKAVDVTVTSPPALPYGPVGEWLTVNGGLRRDLAACDLFTAALLKVTGDCPVCANDSFLSLLCLEGQAQLICGRIRLPMHKGSSIFLPAGLSAQLIAGQEPGLFLSSTL